MTDRGTRYGLTLVAAAIALVFVGVFGVLLYQSQEAIAHSGWGLVTGDRWDPPGNEFGAWPYIFGTIFVSAIAVAIALPLGIGVALFLTELSPRPLRTPLGVLIELLAGVPSLVYGMWGLFFLAPLLRKPLEPWLAAHVQPVFGGLAWLIHWIPWVGPVFGGWLDMLFTGPKIGLGFLLAGIVLTVMILPTIVAISRDALLAVPKLEREAAYALGATRWEVAVNALRSAKVGVYAAASLGLGRALGETIAVTLVIGNVATVAPRLFAPGQTLASTLATQLGEASTPLTRSALLSLGLILFIITLVINFAARLAIEPPWRHER